MVQIPMKNLTTVPVSVCFILNKIDEDSFQLWLQKRSDFDQALNDKWESPGGKWNNGETGEEACLREVLEETNTKLEKIFFFKDYFWENKDKLIHLNVFISKNEMSSEQGQWFDISYSNPLSDLENKIPPINHQIISELSEYIKNNKNQMDYL